jgi:MFS family permease
VLPCLVGLAASGVAMALLPWPEATAALVAIVIVTGPSIGILWTPSMAMISDGADDVGLDQGYAVALINLAWSAGQTAGSAAGARLGEVYGDALPYLILAAACALTCTALAQPRYSAVLAGE